MTAKTHIVAVRGGSVVASTTTDDHGAFTMHLAIGGYLLRLADRGGFADTGALRVLIDNVHDRYVPLTVRTVLGG